MGNLRKTPKILASLLKGAQVLIAAVQYTGYEGRVRAVIMMCMTPAAAVEAEAEAEEEGKNPEDFQNEEETGGGGRPYSKMWEKPFLPNSLPEMK